VALSVLLFGGGLLVGGATLIVHAGIRRIRN
jgi:hypothetical protein